MRKAATKVVAVVLHNVWGAKNNRAFMVVVNFGSFLSSSKNLRKRSQQVLATEMRLARIPPIFINWEKVEPDSPVTKVTQVTVL